MDYANQCYVQWPVYICLLAPLLTHDRAGNVLLRRHRRARPRRRKHVVTSHRTVQQIRHRPQCGTLPAVAILALVTKIRGHGVHTRPPARVDTGRVRLDEGLAPAAGLAPLALERRHGSALVGALVSLMSDRLLVEVLLERRGCVGWTHRGVLLEFLVLVVLAGAEDVQVVQDLAGQVGRGHGDHVELFADFEGFGGSLGGWMGGVGVAEYGLGLGLGVERGGGGRLRAGAA